MLSVASTFSIRTDIGAILDDHDLIEFKEMNLKLTLTGPFYYSCIPST